jgi:hypothetical protein
MVPPIAEERGGLQICKIAVIVLNKQSENTGISCSSSLDVGREATSSDVTRN